MANKTVMIEQGVENVLEQKSGTTLKFDYDGAITSSNYTKADDNSHDLIMTFTTKKDGETQNTTIRIKNFFSTDYMKNISSFKDLIINDETLSINNLIEGFKIDTAKKGIIKGSDFSDIIHGTANNDRIYTNGGNDKIYAGKGNDSIYVGSGENEIFYYNGDGQDTIYMTKDTGTVRLRGLNAAELVPEYTKKGNDLVINRNTWKSGKDAETITIKDYFKQTEEHFYRDDMTLKDVLNDNLGESIRNISAPNMNKSATLQGSFLNDTITGSNKNDKIYTGGGSDIVTASKGNDTIYIDGGEVTLNFNKGDGVDTVYLRKPSDLTKLTLNFVDENSVRGFERSTNGKDLLINYATPEDGKFSEKYDRIIIKDFFKLDESVRNKICYKYQGHDTILFDNDDYIAMFGKKKSSSKIIGSMYRDAIFTGNKNDTIISNSGKDEITGNKGDDRIILAGNDNKELYFQNGDGSDTIITKDFHNATIAIDTFSSEHGYKAYKTADGDIVVGDFGGYTTEKESYKNQTSLSLDDFETEYMEYGKTYDISNSKMFFEKFLKNNEELGENKNNIEFTDGNIDFDNLGEYITKTNAKSSDPVTNKELEAFAGTEKDDYIIASNKTDSVDGGNGDDIIVVNKGKHYVIGGDGDDTLVVKNIGSLNYANGVERLQYNGKMSDLYFVFNVDSNGEIVEEQGFGVGNSSIYKQITNAKFKNGTWFEYEIPEEIIVADKNGLNAQEINLENIKGIIAENVGKYLKNKGYSSAWDLLKNEQNKSMKSLKKDIDGLMKIYKQGISGNDTITATDEHYELLQAGAGNDTYNVSADLFKSQLITIDDTSGKNDTLNIDVSRDDIGMLLPTDLKLKTNKKGRVIYDKSGNPQYVAEGDLYISNGMSTSSSCIRIKDFFGKGKIENIYLANGEKLDINKFLTDFAKLIDSMGCKDFYEAIAKNDKTIDAFLSGAKVTIANEGDKIVVSETNNTPWSIFGKDNENTNYTVDIKDGNDTVSVSGGKVNVTMDSGEKTINFDSIDTTIDASKSTKATIKSTFTIDPENASAHIKGSSGDDIIEIGRIDSTINAGDGNDHIVVHSGGHNGISAGKGNDTIEVHGWGTTNDIRGGEGDDTYIFDNLEYDNNNTITDISGNDQIILKNIAKGNAHIVFNVDSNGNFQDREGQYTIIGDEAYDLWKRDGIVKNTGIQVNDFNSIEKITTEYYDINKYSIDKNQLNTLRETVAGWLADNNYADVNAVFDSKNETDINTLVAQFTNIDWQTGT